MKKYFCIVLRVFFSIAQCCLSLSYAGNAIQSIMRTSSAVASVPPLPIVRAQNTVLARTKKLGGYLGSISSPGMANSSDRRSFIPPPPPQMRVSAPLKRPIDSLLLLPIPETINPNSLSIQCCEIGQIIKLCSEYVVIDTEATGLGHRHELTEVGAVKMRHLKPTGEKFQVYLNPGREVSSSAHQITGHSLKDLKRFPKFRDIATDFIKFIGDSPLIFHTANFDLRLLNKGLKGIIDYKLEDRHIIIDSYLFAKQLHPDARNGLSELAARYKIKRPGNQDLHGALVDADILCEVFRQLLRKNRSEFPSGISSERLPRFDISIFEEINKSTIKNPAKTFLSNLGITKAIPSSFRYVYNMYHRELHRNFPAIIVPMEDFEGKQSGFFVRYLINKREEYARLSHREKDECRSLFGKLDFSFVSIRGNLDAESLVIGGITACLLWNQWISSKSFDRVASVQGVLGEKHSILGIIDPVMLKSMRVYPRTKHIFLLLDKDPLSKDEHKEAYHTLINNHAISHFLPYTKFQDVEISLKGGVIKYADKTWMIDLDKTEFDSRTIIATDERSSKDRIFILIKDAKININDDVVLPENSPEIFFSLPKPKIFTIPLSCSCDDLSLPDLLRKEPDLLFERFQLRILLTQPKDITLHEKVILARKLYDEGLEITDNTPQKRYFHNRGITLSLPSCFRCLHAHYHPGLDDNYPITLVPLKDVEGRLIAVHRLYSDLQGLPLPKTKGYPSKLSLGKAAGAAVDLWEKQIGSEKPDLVMISEGIENALVVREALMTYFDKENIAFSMFLRSFNARYGVTVKGCVGVNGIIDTPIGTDVNSICILADNDGENIEVLETIKKTIESFLLLQKQVYVALPIDLSGEKTDFNDIYQKHYSDNKAEEILKILRASIMIKEVTTISSKYKSLQSFFQDVREGLSGQPH